MMGNVYSFAHAQNMVQIGKKTPNPEPRLERFLIKKCFFQAPQELFEFARYEFDATAMEFLRYCFENGIEILLTSSEMDSRIILEQLMKQNISVQGSIIDGEARYGRYSNNITLSEYAQQDRLALLLTTSLGEATAYTGMGNPKSVEVDEIYKRFGSKVILFPNPTFNRK